MVLTKKIFFLLFTFVSASVVSGQTRIKGDLVYLAELTLSKSPLIQRNALQINQAEGNFRSQRSTFDYQLSSGYSFSSNNYTFFDADPSRPFVQGDLDTNSSEFSISLQKRFRTGLIADFSSSYAGTFNNFPFNDFSEEVGPNISDNTSSATFALTQPLLRGNGLKVTTAFEKSAQLDIESAHENFEQFSAFELSQLAASYWQYVAAYKSLTIFKENENRVRNVLEITEELVKADKKPASDLLQIKADLADQERQTTAAEQSLYAARLNLGRLIGLSEEESGRIEDPTDDFPTLVESNVPPQKNTSLLIQLARANRTDIKALKNTQEGLKLQLAAAKNSMLPQLDLTGFVTLGGAATGGGFEQYVTAFGNRQGRNSTLGLGVTFSLPVNNNLAKANRSLSKIALDDQKIAYDNLQRNIDVNVSIAENNLHNRVLILEKAKETLDYYEQVFTNEQIRFRNGLTTMLNLILFQERLTFAYLEYLSAQQQFAVAIVDLRYETGTLLSIDEDLISATINKEIFYTIPNNN